MKKICGMQIFYVHTHKINVYIRLSVGVKDSF
jgi:hypothetical protein